MPEHGMVALSVKDEILDSQHQDFGKTNAKVAGASAIAKVVQYKPCRSFDTLLAFVVVLQPLLRMMSRCSPLLGGRPPLAPNRATSSARNGTGSRQVLARRQHPHSQPTPESSYLRSSNPTSRLCLVRTSRLFHTTGESCKQATSAQAARVPAPPASSILRLLPTYSPFCST